MLVTMTLVFESSLEADFDVLMVKSLDHEFITRLNEFTSYEACKSYLLTLNDWFDLNLLRVGTSSHLNECNHEDTVENVEEGVVTCTKCFVVVVHNKIDTKQVGFQHSVCYIPKSDYNRVMVIRRYLESVLRIRIVTTPQKMNELVKKEILRLKLPLNSSSVITVLKENKQSQYFKFSHSFLYHCFGITEPPLCSLRELRKMLDDYQRICCQLKRLSNRKNMIKCDFILRKICPPHLQHVFKKCLPKCERTYEFLWKQIM